MDESSPENSGDSSRFRLLNNGKLMDCTSSSPRKSGKKSSTLNRVVMSVPIKDFERGSRFKGETGPPATDAWTWRKYGQKAIKGSPYPRGYYRCSSSKGCPAKKQVERSRSDPNVLLVTYSGEHNHLGPAPRNQTSHNPIKSTETIARGINSSSTITTSTNSSEEEEEEGEEVEDEEEEEEEEEEKPKKFASHAELINKCDKDHNLIAKANEVSSEVSTLISSVNDHFWFSEFESTTSSTMLESLIFTEDQKVRRTHDDDDDITRAALTMRDDEESFFADLGELPECSKVFHPGGLMETEEERRRLILTPCCGTGG